MPTILKYLKLMRIGNCFLAAAGVMVGSYFTWISPFYPEPILTAFAAFLVCAAGNILNDVLDLNIDRINRPNRILVCGEISKEKAVRLTRVLSVMALAISVFVNVWVFVTIIAALILAVLYNFKLKRMPLLGNIIVAFLAGLTFVTGGLAVDPSLIFALPGPMIPAFFAFLFHLAREMVKDVEDIEGDRAFGIKTVPQVLGVSRTLLVAMGLFFIFSLASFIPVLEGWLGRSYEIIAVYLIDLPTLLILIFVWGNPTPKMLRTGSLVLKGGMALGMMALILGR